MYRPMAVVTLALMLGAMTVGCTDEQGAGPLMPNASLTSAPAPAGLRTVTISGTQLQVWPYTGTDLAGTASDPINLIFSGKPDPRELRAALLALDGNRQAYGFPNVPPFNCTWKDAHGNVQAAFADQRLWTASVVQLECGDYAPIRFHIRFFPQGEVTLANAHFEVIIPGTADHQVLSWELGERLVIVDFVRSGLLGGAPGQIAGLNPAPGYRAIPAVIYNGLPSALKQLIGGPSSTATDVPIQSDGNATVLTLAAAAVPVPEVRTATLTLEYNQVIPRPFCAAGPQDFVLVQGPVSLDRTVRQSEDGNLTAYMRAQGQLTVTPINPVTGERGATASAMILDTHEIAFNGDHFTTISQILRKENRPNGEGTSLQIRMQLGADDQYSRTERCN